MWPRNEKVLSDCVKFYAQKGSHFGRRDGIETEQTKVKVPFEPIFFVVAVSI